ncbi:MAG: AAA family ATPase, partial [Arcobacteraceae bacterium]|nr:AAA family ATPase [Arcobacteraceae bacterium]
MSDTTLTPHQQEVFNGLTESLGIQLKQHILNGNSDDRLFSLSGSAGTGKSYLTVQIIANIYQMLKNLPYPNHGIWVTAPTHKAVGILRDEMAQHNIDRVQSSTIHAFLKMKLKRDLNTGAEKYVADKFDQKQNSASLLVVDESSMISEEIYDLIVEALTTRRVRAVLFIGDPYQLLPVKNGDNKVYQLKKQYQLTEIVRQKQDNEIITLSQKLKNCIKEKNYPKLDTLFEDVANSKDIEIFSNKDEFVEDFYKSKNWDKEDKIFTSFTNETVESLNETIRQQYWLERDVLNPNFLLKGDTLRFKSSLNDDGIKSINTNGVYRNDEEVTLDSAVLHANVNLGISYWECQVANRKNSKFYVVDPDSLITFNKILQAIAIDARNAPFPFNRRIWEKYFGLKNSFANVNY